MTGVAYEAGVVVLTAVAVPCAIAWWATLTQSAALVKHAVAVVRGSIPRCSPAEPNWDAHVVTPTLALVREMLPTLSRGWSNSAAASCMCCWSWTLGCVCAALRAQSVGAAAYHGLYGFCAACFPFMILWDMADASTECDLLVRALNEKRIADPSDDTHAKVYKLEVMLGCLNKVCPACVRAWAFLLLVLC